MSKAALENAEYRVKNYEEIIADAQKSLERARQDVEQARREARRPTCTYGYAGPEGRKCTAGARFRVKLNPGEVTGADLCRTHLGRIIESNWEMGNQEAAIVLPVLIPDE